MMPIGRVVMIPVIGVVPAAVPGMMFVVVAFMAEAMLVNDAHRGVAIVIMVMMIVHTTREEQVAEQ